MCLFRDDNPFLNTTRRVTAYCFALLGLIVPLIVIAILYGLIINVLRKNSKGKQVARGKKRVTKMVSAVISSFVICWTPMQIYLLYTHHNQVTILFAIVSQCLVYISSCVNPILYAFLSEPFRQAFKQFLTCSKTLSKHLLTSTENESTTARKSSSYRIMQQQSLTSSNVRKTSSIRSGPEIQGKGSSSASNQYRMSDLNSEVVSTTVASDPMKYNRLSTTYTASIE